MAHLDAEYRRRFQEFHLTDGRILNSKEINWRDVTDWNSVVKIVTNMSGQIYIMETDNSNFKCYMCFRWGGREAIYDSDHNFSHHKPINIWTVGWTDGTNCYLIDIDFFTGNKIKEYTSLLSEFRSHVHPSITAEKLAGQE